MSNFIKAVLFVCKLKLQSKFTDLLSRISYFCQNTHYVLIFVASLIFPFLRAFLLKATGEVVQKSNGGQSLQPPQQSAGNLLKCAEAGERWIQLCVTKKSISGNLKNIKGKRGNNNLRVFENRHKSVLKYRLQCRLQQYIFCENVFTWPHQNVFEPK